jgi:uncharacterized repeat protein (TIGR02543 family)
MTTTSNPTSGGTVSRARVAAAYGKGEKVTLTAIPTTSYRFSEWTRGIIGSINPKDVTITNDTLITANFIRQYIVTFNSQGGSAVLPQTIDSGSFTTTPTSPTRTGYTFTGWFKESACVNEWIFASNQVAINMVLYAKWTINSYIVTYIGNGNTGGIAPSMTTHAYNTIITVLANTGNLVKTNFAFTGWNTASNGSGTGYAIGATFFIAAANVTLFAQWTGKPEFVYPQNNQQLDYIGWYLFKVKPVANATGYLWGFWQNQILIWENYRDEGVFSSEEYGIQPGTIAHGKFSPGAVDVWVRAYVNKAWTDAAIITINLVE